MNTVDETTGLPNSESSNTGRIDSGDGGGRHPADELRHMATFATSGARRRAFVALLRSLLSEGGER